MRHYNPEAYSISTDTKVILLGGTSHTGKSTLARRLADALGWRLISTDQLARHPGRPWRSDGQALPDDVVAYYGERPLENQLDSVLKHYRSNVWPIADAIVRSHLNNPYDPGLVFEGSAILPEAVTAAGYAGVTAFWLSAPEAVIAERIAIESELRTSPESARRLIEAFTARALACNQVIMEGAARTGQRFEALNDAADLETFAVEVLEGVAR